MTLAPKCDCGHGLTRHPTRGACTRCACTWYHPNVRAVKAKARKQLAARGATKAKKEARYKSYLSSAAWKRKRAACIAAAGGRCQNTATRDFVTFFHCGATEDLTAHHLTYARFGRELPEDLQCLCRRCHDKISAHEGRRVG